MKSDHGISAVEVLTATASALLVLVSLGHTAVLQQRLFRSEARQLEARESSRRIVDLVARELRGAGFDPLGEGSFDGFREAIIVAARERIEVRADRHGSGGGDAPDGVVDPASDERVTFFRHAATRMIRQSFGDQVLSLSELPTPADGFVIRYFDPCGAEIVPPPGLELAEAERMRVRRVTIAASFVEPGSSSVRSAETSVALRNRAHLGCIR